MSEILIRTGMEVVAGNGRIDLLSVGIQGPAGAQGIQGPAGAAGPAGFGAFGPIVGLSADATLESGKVYGAIAPALNLTLPAAPADGATIGVACAVGGSYVSVSPPSGLLNGNQASCKFGAVIGTLRFIYFSWSSAFNIWNIVDYGSITAWHASGVYHDTQFVRASDGIIYTNVGGAGQSGFDPVTDGGIHWRPVSALPGGGGGLFDAYGMWTYDYPAGTQGGTSVANAWTFYPLNTEHANSIAGASFLQPVVTLPAGKYFARLHLSNYLSSSSQAIARLRDITNGVTLANGPVAYGAGTKIPIASGEFTLAAQADIRLEYYCTIGQATTGLGWSVTASAAETVRFGALEIYKFA